MTIIQRPPMGNRFIQAVLVRLLMIQERGKEMMQLILYMILEQIRDISIRVYLFYDMVAVSSGIQEQRT